jgi:hypothetical protein
VDYGSGKWRIIGFAAVDKAEVAVQKLDGLVINVYTLFPQPAMYDLCDATNIAGVDAVHIMRPADGAGIRFKAHDITDCEPRPIESTQKGCNPAEYVASPSKDYLTASPSQVYRSPLGAFIRTDLLTHWRTDH